MGTNYEQLSAEERATIMLMAQERKSMRDNGAASCAAPPRRSAVNGAGIRHQPPWQTGVYDAKRAGQDRATPALQVAPAGQAGC